MTSKIKFLIKLSPVALLLVSIAFALMPANKASALDGSQFMPGRIIDDFVFTNKYSMSVPQIQAFLDAKIPACDTDGSEPYSGTTRAIYSANSVNGNTTPFICLNQYYENPNATYAITHTYVNTSGVTVNNTYNYHQNNYYRIVEFITNYVNGDPLQGISSVRPIYSNLGGVVPSGAKSAAQLIWDVAQMYTINPQALIVLLQKEQGIVTDDWAWAMQYEKATGYMCPDTAPCNANKAGFYNQIENAAWQFRADIDNIASLDDWGYYGLGWNNVRYSPDAACGTKAVYIENAATAALYKYTPYTPNDAALANLYGTGDGCSAYGNRNFWRLFNDWFGSTRTNLVGVLGGGVYLIENGVKRVFPSEIAFFSYSYKWSDVLFISATELSLIPAGTPMPYNPNFRNWQLVRIAGSTGVSFVYNGTKRSFANEETFLSQGYKWSDIVTISATELSLIPVGTPMPYNPNFRNWQLVRIAGSTGVSLVYNGTKRSFANEETFLSQGYKWSDIVTISATELSLIPAGTPMPYNPNFRNWQLVRIAGSTGVSFVYNGTKRSFANEETFLSQGYKWSDIVTISATELSLIPVGTPMTYDIHSRDGQLVTTLSEGVYLVDNGTKRPFPSVEIFLSYGYKWSDILTIIPEEMSLIPIGADMTQNI